LISNLLAIVRRWTAHQKAEAQTAIRTHIRYICGSIFGAIYLWHLYFYLGIPDKNNFRLNAPEELLLSR
jgi:hypothetical protein